MAVLKPEPSVMSDGGEEGSQGTLGVRSVSWRPSIRESTSITTTSRRKKCSPIGCSRPLEDLGCEISTTGTYQERLVADQEVCWDQIGSSDIVYFEGTRIIGASPDWSEGDGSPSWMTPRTGTARP